MKMERTMQTRSKTFKWSTRKSPKANSTTTKVDSGFKISGEMSNISILSKSTLKGWTKFHEN